MFATLKDIFVNPAKYRKFWVAFIGFAISLVTAYLGTPVWLPPLVALLTSLGVYGTSNTGA